MCGELWSDTYFLNVTLCLKDSIVMEVQELAAGHQGAMTNSWCHGLVDLFFFPRMCVEVSWLTGATQLNAQRSPLDTLRLVARKPVQKSIGDAM